MPYDGINFKARPRMAIGQYLKTVHMIAKVLKIELFDTIYQCTAVLTEVPQISIKRSKIASSTR